MFDLVVPVYNSIFHVRACLQSIIKYSTLPYHLYICDDGSSKYTKSCLRKLLSALPPERYTLIEQQTNVGYLRNCNAGISSGKSQYVVLINSDTVMTPNYLEKLKADFESDQSIGIINAVSNWANWTRIPFPEGHTYLELSSAVAGQDHDPAQMTDINNASGFFFAVRRELFNELGVFDEAFHPGYWEEADFCMRVLEAGKRVVVDPQLYIFHHGWGSFEAEGRNENMARNRVTFMNRWQEKFEQLQREWKSNNPIAKLQAHLEQPALWKKSEGTDSEVNKADVLIDNSEVTALLHLFRQSPYSIQEELEDLGRLAPASRPKPKVLYILPAISIYGGVISVFQLVNELVLAGVPANIAVYGKIDEQFFRMFPIYFRPYIFPDMESMLADFPECSLVVATHWETTFPAALIATLRQIECAYFVQDYEPDFFRPDEQEKQRYVAETYNLITHKIVKSDWLENKLQMFSGEVKKIPLGLNLDIFHDTGKPRNRQILSFARPSSPRRNFDMLKQVFAQLHQIDPSLELAIYGVGYENMEFDFPFKDYGKIDSMTDMAKALNESLILLDCSTFQGFGRPGLEAMACGTAAIVTQEGGITEYAKHMHNCLLIDPEDLDGIVAGILKLVNDQELRERLIAQGTKTAGEYCHHQEASKTLAYFKRLTDNL